MKKNQIGVVGLIVLAAGFGTASTATPHWGGKVEEPAKTAQAKQEPKEIQEIKELIKKAKEAEKDGKSDDVKKIKNEIIKKVDEYYKIPKDNVDGEPQYDPNETGDGNSKKSGKKVKVTLGEVGFTTPGWIASTKLHEMVGHGGQAADGRWYKGDKGNAINDIEAYDLEIKNAEKDGLSPDELKELEKRRKALYDSLSDENKKKIDKKDYTMAFAAPTNRSEGELAGRAEIFVAGEVLEEETMVVTVRGPSTLEGLVVTVESGGKTIKGKTDGHGRVILDFWDLGLALSESQPAQIRVTGNTGNTVTQSQTRIQPGSPGVPTRPEVPNLPKHLRNGDIVTIPGKSLGAESQLILGSQRQETLTATSRELTTYVSAPAVGPQAAYVITPYGESQSQTVQCYNFTVKASKNTITRGEHVTATAQYEGLPPGAEVVFTNATPQVIAMTPRGPAQVQGATSIVKITNPAGTIQLDLTGQSAGNFVVKYEIRFPK